MIMNPAEQKKILFHMRSSLKKSQSPSHKERKNQSSLIGTNWSSDLMSI